MDRKCWCNVVNIRSIGIVEAIEKHIKTKGVSRVWQLLYAETFLIILILLSRNTEIGVTHDN